MGLFLFLFNYSWFWLLNIRLRILELRIVFVWDIIRVACCFNRIHKLPRVRVIELEFIWLIFSMLGSEASNRRLPCILDFGCFLGIFWLFLGDLFFDIVTEVRNKWLLESMCMDHWFHILLAIHFGALILLRGLHCHTWLRSRLNVGIRNLRRLSLRLLLCLFRKFLSIAVRTEILFVFCNWALRKRWIVVVGISHWVYNLRLIILRNRTLITSRVILLHAIVRGVLLKLSRMLNSLLRELRWYWCLYFAIGWVLFDCLRLTWAF